MTLKEIVNIWMSEEKERYLKPQTLTRYKSLLDIHILPTLGDFKIHDVTRKTVMEFLLSKRTAYNAKAKGGLSASSINMMLSLLNMIFDYAMDIEALTLNPCARIKRISAPSVCRKAYAFSKAEQRAIEEAIMKENDERLFGIIICFYTGLRLGELLSLEWDDLSENCSVLTVSKTVYRKRNSSGHWEVKTDTPKTASSYRIIPLPKHLSDRLNMLKLKSKSKYIVENKKHGRMPTRSYQYIFEKITQKANVRRLSFHSIRHTFATRAVENGMDIKTLSEIMGHKNATLTLNLYAHSMIETKIEMMNKMNAIL